LSENSVLHDKPGHKSGGGNDCRLQRALQHPTIPVGLQPVQEQVHGEVARYGAVGGLVMDHRDDHFSRRSVRHSDRQRTRYEGSLAHVERRSRGGYVGSRQGVD